MSVRIITHTTVRDVEILTNSIVRKGYSPFRDPETGTWFEYDDINRTYYDTEKPATAYDAAVADGYTGTEAEFNEGVHLSAEYADNAQASATAAANSAEAAQEALDQFQTDKTLTITDRAADSKTVGDRLSAMDTTIATKASNAALNALGNTINSTKADKTTVNDLQAQVNTKAAAADVSALGDRVTTAEDNISTLQTQMATKASSTTVTALTTRVTTAESNITALQTGKADASTVTSLTGRVTTAESNITALQTGKEDKTTVTALTGRVATNESDISSLKDKISNKADVIVSSASGVIASFTDGADGLPLKKATYYIEPKQSGTGDPSPDNIRPISGWTGINSIRNGKNLLPSLLSAQTIDGVTYTPQSDGSIKVVGTSTGAHPCYILTTSNSVLRPGIEYVVSAGSEASSSGVRLTISLNRGSSTRYVEVTSNAERNFTLNDGEKASVYFRTNGGSTSINATLYPMIRIASDTDATFAPYTEQTIPITFPTEAGTVYGGNVVINEDGSGVLTIDRKTHTVSSSDTIYYGTNRFSVSEFADKRISTGIDLSVECSHYYPHVAPITNQGVTGTIAFYTNTIHAYIVDKRFSDLSSFKAYADEQVADGTPIQITYYLNTPTTYNLTAEQITTLLGVNNIWCDTGDTSVEYRADTKLYIDGLIGTTDDDYTANQNIASGQFFSIGNHLYRATSAIASGATIVPGTNCVETNIAEQLTALYASLT